MGSLFQDDQDFEYFQSELEEIYEQLMAEASVYLLDPEVVDPLYLDSPEPSFGKGTSAPSYKVPMYFAELPEWKAKLMKLGLDESRPLKGFAFKRWFEKEGVRPPDIGDRIGIEGDLYEVTQSNPSDYFMNTRKAFAHSVNLIRARPRSLAADPIPNDTDGEGDWSDLPNDNDIDPVRPPRW